MQLFDLIADTWYRLLSYALWEIVLELILIWVVVYLVVRFVQGTRAAGALKGIVVVLLVLGPLVWLLSGGERFGRIAFLFDRFLAVVALGLVVVFQPELRRAMIKLGETPRFWRSNPSKIAELTESVAVACRYLSKARFGAIIVIERQTGLDQMTEGGTRLDAALSSRLLQTIFFPGSALHDLAVVIKGGVVHAAGVQLPMAEPEEMPDPSLGARHRAAVGLTKECDALVVVVSEESGKIRVAEYGRLGEPVDPDELADRLSSALRRIPPTEGETVAENEELAEAMKPLDAPEPQRAEPDGGKAAPAAGS
ncbi:MAG: diadenylate cyclase CdaA [Planctomycetota bacterium]